MADIICPNCGKNTPADEELCQYCYTRLKPSGGLPVGGSDDLMGLLGSQEEGADVPDWLRTLRPEDQEELGPADQAAGTESDSAMEGQQDETLGGQPPAEEDWMSRLEGEALPDFSVSEAPADSGEATLPGVPPDELAGLDWAAETPVEAPGPEVTPSQGSGFEEALDWLSSLEKEPSADETGAASPDFLAPTEAEGGQDWLSQPPKEEPLGEVSLSDETIQAEPGAAEEQISPADELSDWLARLGDQSVSTYEGKEAGAFSPMADEAAPDFSVQEPGQTPAEDDWLSSLQSGAASGPISEETEASSGEQADWLSRLGSEGFESEAPAPLEVTPPAESALPLDFASESSEAGLQPPPGETGEEETPVSPFTFDEQVLGLGEESTPADWFSEPAQAAPSPAAEDELPDWLRQAGEGESPFGARPAQQSTAPDWRSGRIEAQPSSGEPEAEPAGETPDWLGQLGEPAVEPAQETPEWLGQIGEPAIQEEPTPALDSTPEEANFAALNLDEGAVPDWLAKLDINAAPPGGESGVPAFVLDEETSPFSPDESLEEAAPVGEFGQAPDWLNQISGDQALPPIEEQPAPTGEAGLAPAELPGWLEAMRPSEGEGSGAIFRDTSDSRIEAAGLLAGVPGILPVEQEVIGGRKPPVYSIKLHVAQEQQDRVDMLKELLADEERPAVLPAPATLTTVFILRLLILGVFILGAIFAFWAGVQQTPTPGAGSIPQEVLDLRMVLDNLSNGAPVLIAFDYEPASAPEMEAAAMGVIDQLLLKGSVIRAVSTTNSGAALAKRMLGEALSMPDLSQSPPLNIAILGYIPGGAAGLQAFGRDPAGLLPYNLESTDNSNLNAWAEPVFNPVKGLANFKLVLVITDNGDTARSWVEQTSSQLQSNNIPLLMVVSAQSEPLVRPYYETNPRQVAGMATGVMGGVFMESLNGRDGIARRYMDAYSLTLMVAVLLLVIGSLVNLVSGQLALNKQLKGEAKA